MGRFLGGSQLRLEKVTHKFVVHPEKKTLGIKGFLFVESFDNIFFLHTYYATGPNRKEGNETFGQVRVVGRQAGSLRG
jgi:non-homologous end joining protein Ku